MLTSMTGHGQAQKSADGIQVWAEVRAVNNRYLKVSISYSERMAELESEIRALTQRYIRRGSVHVSLELRRETSSASIRINTALLQTLLEQVRAVDAEASVDGLISLPGVVEELGGQGLASDTPAALERQLLLEATESALQQLVTMRQQEGESAARDLLENCQQIQKHLATIEQRAPQVARDYATRLTERINSLLAEHDAAMEPRDVVREVGIFADKCDISEEIVRLQTHIDQFSDFIKSGQGDGRKLEFLSQEMLRETNTIGSKANDSQIAQNVVEIKTAIDRIREMTQNVE